MENKINLVALLKDCPSGMELNCTMYDNLYFDKVVEEYRYPIGCYTIYDGCRTSVNFTEFGEFNNYGTAKCVIFPKGKTTWEGFQRPFKDGDIIYVCDEYSDATFTYLAILKQIEKGGKINSHCFYNYEDDVFSINDFFYDSCNIRFANEEEKEKLFQAIKDNGFQWNAETKTLEKLIEPKFKVGDKIVNDNYVVEITEIDIEEEVYIYESKVGGVGAILFTEQDKWELVPNKFDINSLVPFESKVLVRDSNVEKWRPATWGYYDKDSEYNYPYEVVGGHGFSMCIPYEGNSHLMGKTDDCDEFYKIW